MKKIQYLFIVAALGFSITSCKDEVLVPVENTKRADSLVSKIEEQSGLIVEANTDLNELTITNQNLRDLRDSLNGAGVNGETKVLYTVNVMSLANLAVTSGKTAGVSGASVTFTQNGTAQTKTTDLGLATFNAVNGTATVFVTAPDHGDLEYIVEIFPGSYQGTVNSSSQVFLFPKASAAGSATISGSVYANTSTLNDTLRRIYGAGAPTAVQGTYISNPGHWAYTNYTQWNVYKEANTIYGSTSGNEVSFEKGANTIKINAIPSISSTPMNNPANWTGNNSLITSVTYKGIISSANVDDTGKYSLPVFARAEGGVSVTLTAQQYTWSHERLTTNSGVDNEPGSVEKTFNNYNTVTGVTDKNYKARVVTNNYVYYPHFPNDGNVNSPVVTVRSNSSIVRNVYYFPYDLVP